MVGHRKEKVTNFYQGERVWDGKTKKTKCKEYHGAAEERSLKISSSNKFKLNFLAVQQKQQHWRHLAGQEYYSPSYSLEDPFSMYQLDYDPSCLGATYTGMSNQGFVSSKNRVTFIVIGHAHSGKSTAMGHLLSLEDSAYVTRAERVFKEAEKMKKSSFKYAFLLDKLKVERKSGHTMTLSYGNFETKNFECTLIDAPGRRESIINMISGASQADCGILIIDSSTGGFETGFSEDGQTTEHALIAFALGVKKLICCINKMDATTPPYSERRYDLIVKQVRSFLLNVGFKSEDVSFLPLCAFKGENLRYSSTKFNWYEGPTLYMALDNITQPKRPVKLPLRLPLQEVYHIGGIGVVPVGRVETGILKPGMAVTFGPTGVRAKVMSVERHHNRVGEAYPGDIIGFNVDTLAFEDLKHGFVASDTVNDPVQGVTRFTSHVIILNNPGPIKNGYAAKFYCHTSQTLVFFDKILQKISRHSGNALEVEPESLKSGDAAILEMVLAEPLVVERFADYHSLGRFVICDTSQIVGVGLILKVDKGPT